MAVFPIFLFPLLGTPTAPFNELSFYVAGTDTALNVYSDVSGDTAWAQPIVLNAAGEADGIIYVDPDTAYKVVYEDQFGVAIPGYPVDFIPPGEILNVMTTSITTLTNAQIKTLPTTPVTIVAAPTSGLWNRILAVSVYLNSTAGAYTNINTTYAALQIAAATSGSWMVNPMLNDSGLSPALTQMTNLFGAAHTVVAPFGVPFSTAQDTDTWIVTDFHNYGGNVVTNVSGLATVVSIDNNGSGALTGGNAANTMTITVYFAKEILA